MGWAGLVGLGILENMYFAYNNQPTITNHSYQFIAHIDLEILWERLLRGIGASFTKKDHLTFVPAFIG
jgi:hypothetical protein